MERNQWSRLIIALFLLTTSVVKATSYWETTSIRLQKSKLIASDCGRKDIEENDLLTFISVPQATSYKVHISYVDSVGLDTIFYGFDNLITTSTSFRLSDFPTLTYRESESYFITITPYSGSSSGTEGALCEVQTRRRGNYPIVCNLSECDYIRNGDMETLNYPISSPHGIDLPNPPLACFGATHFSPDIVGNTNKTVRMVGFLSNGRTKSEGTYQNLEKPVVNGKSYVLSYRTLADPYNPNTTLDNQLFYLGHRNVTNFDNVLYNSYNFNRGANIIPQTQLIFNGGRMVNGYRNFQTCFKANDNYDQFFFYPEQDQSPPAWWYIDDISLMPLADAGVDVCTGNVIGPCDEIVPKQGASVHYSWSPTNGLSCTNCPNPIATPSVPTTYTLIATYDNGTGHVCSDTDQVHVTIKEDFKIKSYHGNRVCFGSPITLYPQSSAYPATNGIPFGALGIRWFNSGGTQIHMGSTLVTATPDTYTAKYTNANGCEMEASFTVASCCIDDSEPAIIIPSDVYDPIGNPLPAIADGSTVYIEGDITLKDYTLTWRNLTIYVKGYVSQLLGNSPVIGTSIKLENSELRMGRSTIESPCDMMWTGFRYGFNAYNQQNSLSLSSCKVADAYQAVALANASSLFALNTTFENNYQGIYEFGLHDGNNNRFDIEKCTFKTTGSIQKEPYTNQLGRSGIELFKSLFTTTNSFKGNTYSNLLYGMEMTDSPITGEFVVELEQPTFNNIFLASIISSGANLTVVDGTFNFPSYSHSAIPQPYKSVSGIVLNGISEINLVGCNFTSSLSPDFSLPSRTGVFSATSYKDITIDNCDFTSMNTAISISPEGVQRFDPITQTQVIEGTQLNITSNNFTDCNTSIQFRDNSVLAGHLVSAPMYGEMEFTISCNDFVKNYTGSTPMIGINIAPNTTMPLEMGACGSGRETGNGFPISGNKMTDVYTSWISPANWTSIVNNGTNSFDYSPYINEFVGTTTGIISFQNCFNPGQTYDGTINSSCINDIDASIIFPKPTKQDDENYNLGYNYYIC